MSRPGGGRRERTTVALLLDEMHAPAVAEALRRRGHDVLAVAERPDLRALSDEELFAWAGEESRLLVTENVKDFRRLLLRTEDSPRRRPGLLYTSRRTFPRSRRNPGTVVTALDAWLCGTDVDSRPPEDWLSPA